jgi:hypothetical protein
MEFYVRATIFRAFGILVVGETDNSTADYFLHIRCFIEYVYELLWFIH